MRLDSVSAPQINFQPGWKHSGQTLAEQIGGFCNSVRVDASIFNKLDSNQQRLQTFVADFNLTGVLFKS